MADKIVRIEFNIWANEESDGQAMTKAICDFINWNGEHGIKVTAGKVTEAIGRWQSNPLIKRSIMNHFEKE